MSRWGRPTVVTVAGALAIAALAPLVATASTSSRLQRIGRAPRAPAGAVDLGVLATTGSIPIDVVLRPADPGSLADYASAVSTPGSPVYRHFLTPEEFAAAFAPSPSDVASVSAALRNAGLSVGGTDPGGLIIHASGTAARLDHGLSTQLERYRLRSGTTGYVNQAAPAMPAGVASQVAGIVGLSSLGPPRPRTLRSPRADASNGVVPHATPASPQPGGACAGQIGIARDRYSSGLLTVDQVADAYDYDPLYDIGDFGQGQTVGIIEFAPFIGSDIATFEACFSPPLSPSITEVPVDGGPGATATSGLGIGGEEEAELDIEDVAGLAPGASLKIFEAPQNSNDTQILDVWSAAVNDPSVNVISTSWGNCEPRTNANFTNAEAMLFQQAATEGKTITAASGDSGSEDCSGLLRGSAAAQLAADDPSSQPFVTGVGGTQLTNLSPPTEVVWNGTAGNGISSGAGGGGVSTLWAMPDYQGGANPALGVLGANAACPSGNGNCRETPDVAADAGTRVAFYCTENDCLSGGWTGFGGTSVASPTWAALFALANANPACAAGPVGFANPALYAIAGGPNAASALRDVTSGQNDFLNAHGGLYAAAPGFDQASGLGTPIAGSGSDGAIVSQLCSGPRVTTFPSAVRAVTTTTTTTTTLAPIHQPSGPTLRSLSIKAGAKAGGTRVVLRGTGFTKVKAVHFGKKKARSFRILSSTRILAVAPAGSGTTFITVTTTAGTTRQVRAARFTYLGLPSVARLSPATASHRGGTRIVVRGAGFVAVAAVRFGTARARSFTVISPTAILAVEPSGSGTTHVTVTTPGGTSPASTRSAFSFR